MAWNDDGDRLWFSICCTTSIPIDIKERFLETSCWNRQWESIFIESLDEVYTEPSEPGTTVLNSDPPFQSKSEKECWEILQRVGENGSQVTCDYFVLMDQRSAEDETVLLVQRDEEEDVILSVRAEFKVALLHLSGYSIGRGSVAEDLDMVASKALDGVLRDWGRDAKRRREAVEPRGAGFAIGTSNDPQLQCALFRLPAELRMRIFEYVVGSGVIHVSSRLCKPTARPSPRFGFYETYSYVICPLGEEHWAKSYESSKLPDSTENDPRTNYRMLHMGCGDPLREFTSQQYTEEAEGCRLGPYTRRADPQKHFEECQDCQNHRAALEREFGPAPEGLKRRHAESGLDLNFLLTCRQIYHEAWNLPFTTYTFDFELPHLEYWTSKILYEHQKRAIQSAHFNEPAGAPPFLHTPGTIDKIRELLPGLKQLRLSLPHLGMNNWEGVFCSNKVETAEVIDTEPGDLSFRRKRAEGIEALLTSSE